VISLFLASLHPGAFARSERITGFVLGHSGYMWHNPFRILFRRDPIFAYDIYPLPPDLSDDDKRKLDRVYYPRTKDVLTDSYDLMVFHDARIQHLTTRQLHDLDYAFREAEMAAFCGLCLGWDYAWEPTILRDVVPISEHGSVSPHFRSYKVEFRTNLDEVFIPFITYGVENAVGEQYTEMKVKQGATIWGDIRPYDLPWLVSWRPGGGNPGIQWVVSHIFDDWWSEQKNPYALDVATNMILYSLEMDLIADIPARREARRMFRNLQTQKSLILSMIEWADNFGANSLPLSDELLDLEVEMDKAVDDYAAQDYEPAIGFLESMTKEVKRISQKAVELKDRALFWVYTSEWLVVTATAIISGLTVWSLMIKRKMHREVRATRLRRV